jgi:hypothetical protein
MAEVVMSEVYKPAWRERERALRQEDDAPGAAFCGQLGDEDNGVAVVRQDNS